MFVKKTHIVRKVKLRDPLAQLIKPTLDGRGGEIGMSYVKAHTDALRICRAVHDLADGFGIQVGTVLNAEPNGIALRKVTIVFRADLAPVFEILPPQNGKST